MVPLSFNSSHKFPEEKKCLNTELCHNNYKPLPYQFINHPAQQFFSLGRRFRCYKMYAVLLPHGIVLT